jgi:hypothetical protein
MTIHHFTPFAVDKNLGKAYNDCFEMIGKDDWACIRDGDTMFLTPDFGDIIFNYAYQNPGCILTCYTNRLHHLARAQLLDGKPGDDDSILNHIQLAESQKSKLYGISSIYAHTSMLLMLMSKATWEKSGGFKEGIGLLGVDTEFYKRVREIGIPILRMNGLYIFHTYRLGKSITDKSHLV